MQYTCGNVFSAAHHSLDSSILMASGASAYFLVHLFHISKTFSFNDFFHRGKQKKKSSGKDQGNRQGGGWGVLFLVKNWTLRAMWAGALVNHPSWEKALKSPPKKCTEAECSLSQKYQLEHWYRWFLEHWPSGGSLYCKEPSLQKIILVFFFRSPVVHDTANTHLERQGDFYRSNSEVLAWFWCGYF